jgi:hypothetical protein
MKHERRTRGVHVEGGRANAEALGDQTRSRGRGLRRGRTAGDHEADVEG